MQIGRYECQEYDIEVSGRAFCIYGPRTPDALLDDPDVERRFERDEYMPYWATPWPAAVMLAEHLAGLPPIGRPVLEIGAGLGIVSIVATSFGHDMIATDYDADSLEFIRESARRNGVALKIQRLDWRAPISRTYESIVAADVLYEQRHLDPVADMLARCLAAEGVALIADPHRACADAFPGRADARRLECHELPGICRRVAARDVPASAEVPAEFNGRIFRLVRRRDNEV